VYYVVALAGASAMPVKLCDQCGKKGEIRADSPDYPTELYIRCDACGAVWILHRSDRTKSPCLVVQRKP